MVGVSIKTVDNTKRVQKAAEDATYKNLGHAAASIRKDIISTIKTRRGPSPPGTPPHTRGQNILRRAILFYFDKQALSAVIGPVGSMVGDSMKAHEFGGRYGKETFPKRPFMLPGLERAVPRLAGEWAGTVGS